MGKVSGYQNSHAWSKDSEIGKILEIKYTQTKVILKVFDPKNIYGIKQEEKSRYEENIRKEYGRKERERSRETIKRE